MAIQHTLSQAGKSRPSVILGLGLLLSRANPLGEATVNICHLICALIGGLFKFAPPIILAGCHALASCLFAHQLLFQCVQALLTSWELLHFVCGAA